MTLAERLAAAREQRRLAAGLPPSTDPPGTDPPGIDPPGIDLTGPGEETRDEDVVIDLREFRRTPPAPSDPPPASGPLAPGFSFAARVAASADGCPSCDSSLRLDMEDVVGGVNHYTCTGCGLLVQVAR
jgi:hypothetical protein